MQLIPLIIVILGCNQIYKNSYSQELIVSTSKGELSKVKDLIKKGADINSKNEYGKTPLHIAVENNYEDIVKVLLENKADVNIKDNNGNTPLHIAVMKGNEYIIKELLKNGANENIKNNDGKTPKELAIENGIEDLFKKH
ncbi:MAG: ankyrin repeat domain-containing protein [candidate division WOR-3 bacterium]|nr:ankyrin repeat domain-containing protein [candidate division WOR-3 bacterium]MCX7947055.1 ankyrin repeat domain-containing protein [candidate division WOR-3 bacterium]MDW8149904.1 ankyrin repeat domain-containing protein [candidate division WOR-3 bacterium]